MNMSMISSKCIRYFIAGHGNQVLFSSLHPTVVQGLPKEPAEWRRYVGLMVWPRTNLTWQVILGISFNFKLSGEISQKNNNAGADFLNQENIENLCHLYSNVWVKLLCL